MFDITIIIKTFLRPDCLEMCLKSIRKYYPDIQILVADDSKNSCDGVYPNEIRYSLPFNIGLSAGRNFLLERVETKYFVLVDDDFIFTDKTNLRFMRKILIDDDIDLISGVINEIPKNKIIRYEGLLELRGTELRYIDNHRGITKSGLKMYDLVMNFYMAKTDSIKGIMWDEELKIVEHTDFFLRAKGILDIACCPEIVVNHVKDNNERPEYYKFRNRYNKFEDIFKLKHGIKRIIPFGG